MQGPITKTEFMRGAKCELRPYLDRHGRQETNQEIAVAPNLTATEENLTAGINGITAQVHEKADEAVLNQRPKDGPHYRSDGYLVEQLAEQHRSFAGALRVPMFGLEGLIETHKAIREGANPILQGSFQAMGLYARPDILSYPGVGGSDYLNLLSEEQKEAATEMLALLRGVKVEYEANNEKLTYEIEDLSTLYAIPPAAFKELEISDEGGLKHSFKEILETLNPKWKRKTKAISDNIEEFQRVILEKSLKACYGEAVKKEAEALQQEILLNLYGGRYGKSRAIYEVKSTGSIKPEHHEDVAFQFHTLRLAGVNVKHAFIMYVNSDYIRLTEDIDPEEYFRIRNITPEVIGLLPSITNKVQNLDTVLSSSTPPTVVPSSTRCGYRDLSKACPHISSCWAGLPRDSEGDLAAVQLLPRIGVKKLSGYIQEQTPAVTDLDLADKRITTSWLPIVRAFKSMQPQINLSEIKAFLDTIQIGESITFIDFETYSSAIPLIGSKPFAKTPIQSAICIQDTNGFLTSKEFLSQVKQDPSKLFAEHLINSVADSGPIVVWHKDFETGVIKTLAERFPDLEVNLLALNDRIVDLEVPFKKDYVDKKFGGSTSLKNVLPVIAPDMAYDQMAITSGIMVASKWVQMLETQDPSQKMQIMMELKKYCMHDVNAMLRLYNFLDTLVKQSSPQS